MSACTGQVALERNVYQYDKLADFITLVTEMVLELLNYKQKTQLILGLRARSSSRHQLLSLQQLMRDERLSSSFTSTSEFTFMSDTILSTLVSKQTSAESEDHFDQKTDGEDVDSKETPEQKTAKQEDSCSMKDIFEDDQETDDSSTETNSNSRLHEYELSPLTSSHVLKKLARQKQLVKLPFRHPDAQWKARRNIWI